MTSTDRWFHSHSWGGFGFGIWRSQWLAGEFVWSIAFGPITFYLRRLPR